MRTYSTRASDISRKWHVIDASGQTLGKLAVKAAGLLMGKQNIMFAPNIDAGDYVIVINASNIKVTGKKMTDKIYYRHSTYPGGLKAIPLGEMLRSHPQRVIEHAVRGMLPRNRLGNAMIKKLKVYAENKHPHEAQVKSNGTPQGGAS